MKSKVEDIKENTTVLEDLLFWIESFENMPIKPTYTNMKEKIWQLLPKEKQQIIDAYNSGDYMSSAIRTIRMQQGLTQFEYTLPEDDAVMFMLILKRNKIWFADVTR